MVSEVPAGFKRLLSLGYSRAFCIGFKEASSSFGRFLRISYGVIYGGHGISYDFERFQRISEECLSVSGGCMRVQTNLSGALRRIQKGSGTLQGLRV